MLVTSHFPFSCHTFHLTSHPIIRPVVTTEANVERTVLRMLSLLQEDTQEDLRQRRSRFLQQLVAENVTMEQLKACTLNLCTRARQNDDAITLYEFLLEKMPSVVEGDVGLFNAIVTAYIFGKDQNNEAALEIFNMHPNLKIPLNRGSLSAGILAAREAQDVESMWKIYKMADDMPHVATAFTYENVMQTFLAFMWKNGRHKEVIHVFDKERKIGRMAVDEGMVCNVITSHAFLRQPVDALVIFEEFESLGGFLSRRRRVGASIHLSLLQAFNFNGLWEEIIRFYQRWVFRKIPIAQEAVAFNHYLIALLQLRWYEQVFKSFEDPSRRYCPLHRLCLVSPVFVECSL